MPIRMFEEHVDHSPQAVLLAAMAHMHYKLNK